VGDHSNILLFDGICNLCNRVVTFFIKRDPEAKFKFASLQSATGKELVERSGIKTDGLDSIVLMHKGRFYIKSTAALLALKELGGIWRLCYILIIVPRFIRDFVYDVVAANRYKIFGKRDACMVPAGDVRKRFLD